MSIDIESMYAELLSTMTCNFNGSPEERFVHAKALFLNGVSNAIEDNRDLLVREVSEKETS
jgi:hypothetical protein